MEAPSSKEKSRSGNGQNPSIELRATVDSEGRIILPPEIGSYYGLRPGAQIFVEEVVNGLKLRMPVCHLAKVYIEPTNRCNLECRTCIRNSWDEPLGKMEWKTFSSILEGLRLHSPSPKVFLGGFGEPLAHPQIVEMVAGAKALGAPVELITNGTLLTREMSQGLIKAGLDILWVSLDGAKPESYADVRLGAALPEIIANFSIFRDVCHLAFPHKPQLGIVFVAMKRNIADLPAVLSLGSQLGAQRFLVTNVLPYTAEMREEVLYWRALGDFVFGAYLELPKLDMNEETRDPIYWTLRSGKNVAFAGSRLGETNNRCPFIESGSTAISWEGNLSPCLALLHSNINFLDGRDRFSRKYLVGNIQDRDLKSLWNDPEYVAFRERVKAFDFSPCYICGGCELAEKNEEDCFGNRFPTCGGCLWAQGVIRCP
jgi:MoaA/NifB/PqqE/SkfB family radical SAM enzyme